MRAVGRDKAEHMGRVSSDEKRNEGEGGGEMEEVDGKRGADEMEEKSGSLSVGYPPATYCKQCHTLPPLPLQHAQPDQARP